MTTKKTYTCEICHNVNSVHRFRCKACGAVPAIYSFTGKAMIEKHNAINPLLEVHVAFGAERQNFSHATKVRLRNVPLDYYADSDAKPVSSKGDIKKA